MKFWKNVFPFLLLNIIISAATVYAVLLYWEKQHPQSLPSLSLPTESVVTTPGKATAIPTLRVTPADLLLNVKGVFGAGDISVEYVLIENASSTSLNLKNWKLSGNGNTYTFPNLNLGSAGAVRLYSQYGTDSVIELYWNKDAAQWKSGSELIIMDPDGQVRVTYTVP